MTWKPKIGFPPPPHAGATDYCRPEGPPYGVGRQDRGAVLRRHHLISARAALSFSVSTGCKVIARR